MTTITQLVEKAIEARQSLFDTAHQSAFRLFNGFSEGNPDLVIDLYASTLVFHNYAEDITQGRSLVNEAKEFLVNQFPWVRVGILKTRNGRSQDEKRGQVLFGENPDRKIREHRVWYAVD